MRKLLVAIICILGMGTIVAFTWLAYGIRPGTPVSDDRRVSTDIQSEKPFPVDAIGRELSVADAWIEPIALRIKDGCITNPDGDLGAEIVDPGCKVWAEAAVTADGAIVAQVVPTDVAAKQGALTFSRSGAPMTLPALPVDAMTRVSVSYADERTILVNVGGYEWRKQFRLQGTEWAAVSVPPSVLAAFPWDDKPPFELSLGTVHDLYTETRWPPGAEGYFGDDEYRSKWAFAYVVDRNNGEVVEMGVVARR